MMREALIALVIITCVVCRLVYLVAIQKTRRVEAITDLIRDVLCGESKVDNEEV